MTPSITEPEYWLSLDLSTAHGSAALHRLESSGLTCVKSHLLEDGEYKHAEKIVPLIDEMLSNCGIQLSYVSRFLTNQGPGSFTGLRVAFATVKAFAMANQKPIETFSGSEARALAWANASPTPLPCDNLFVITHVSLNRFVQAHFKVRDGNTLVMKNELLKEGAFNEPELEEGIVLIDEKTPRALVPQTDAIEVIEFPVQARFFAETLSKASTRKTFSHIQEWVALSPTYFGDKS